MKITNNEIGKKKKSESRKYINKFFGKHIIPFDDLMGICEKYWKNVEKLSIYRYIHIHVIGGK